YAFLKSGGESGSGAISDFIDGLKGEGKGGGKKPPGEGMTSKQLKTAEFKALKVGEKTPMMSGGKGGAFKPPKKPGFFGKKISGLTNFVSTKAPVTAELA